MICQNSIPSDIVDLYEIHDYKHAATILKYDFPNEFDEICNTLRTFRITKDDVLAPGGSESSIPKRFSDLLRPRDWKERQLNAKIIVDGHEFSQDTHKVDYLKKRIAFDLEWNSKDQTFDRDLYAFRTFFEYDRISVGIIVTRSQDLVSWFKELGINHKYGASTTHIGKLLPRLDAGRNGGCPILVFGITQQLIKDTNNE